MIIPFLNSEVTYHSDMILSKIIGDDSCGYF